MKRTIVVILLVGSFIFVSYKACSNHSGKKTVRVTEQELLDKIKGGWVGKAYGVSFGGPTEFRYQGEIIEGPLSLDKEGLKWLPWQDDMYVNMAFLKTLAEEGFSATIEDFAKDFAYGGFLLWHANGQGRQNILSGIKPGLSGHPYYNPHADDIDFQIECDFIGLVSPGLPESSKEICDKVGHIMNYGDGVYGGYFVTAMYAAAFIEDDPYKIVKYGLSMLPKGSGYAQIIRDVLNWYEKYPDDWKKVWKKIEDKYNRDLCPWGVKSKFNIQARLNGSYIALGILYGNGDLKKTVEIATRCGQDSDCNPGNAGGVVGTMLGYSRLPKDIKEAMKPYMKEVFCFTPFSIDSASKVCLRLAVQNILRNNGNKRGDTLEFAIQSFVNKDEEVEVSFPTLEPIDKFSIYDDRIKWVGDWSKVDYKGDEVMRRSDNPGDYMEVNFEGSAVYVQGDLRYDQGILEAYIDGKLMQERDMYLPKKWELANQSTAVWITGLPFGNHKLVVKVTGRKNPKSEGITISLGKVVTYRGEVAKLPKR